MKAVFSCTKKNNILLTGFMGAGKTTIAKNLTNILQLPWIDSDKVIEKTHKKSIVEIFQESEKSFRKMETEFLMKQQSIKNTIFSLGGGIIENKNNRALLKKIGIVFFLFVPFSTLWERIQNSSTRPLIINNNNPKFFLQELYDKRLSLYQEADFIITNIHEQETVKKIVNLYKK